MINKLKKDLEERYIDHQHRLNHVEGVVNTAIKLGKTLDLDLEKLEIASLLHDITKYEVDDYHKEKIIQYFPDNIEILQEYSPKLWHAFSAYAYAIEEYHIKDKDILDAILHHAVGAPNMNPYAEVLFLSDYIEPSRSYGSSVKVRKIAEESFYKAIYVAIDDTITFHESLGEHIPSIALKARDYYQRKQEDLWKN